MIMRINDDIFEFLLFLNCIESIFTYQVSVKVNISNHKKDLCFELMSFNEKDV